MIEEIFNNPDPKNAKKLDKILVKRFQRHAGDPFKKLSERLEKVRKQGRPGPDQFHRLVEKELCKLAKETVQAGKRNWKR